MSGTDLDAVVVGAGPNGLTAAVALARAGLSTLVLEAHDTPGGGARTQELTLPGFLHDVCSAVHPLGMGSPYLRRLALERHGLAWLEPPVPLAHVMEDGSAVLLEHSLEATAQGLGRDGPAYRRLLEPLVEGFDTLSRSVLGPVRIPSSPVLMARFGLSGLRSMKGLARAHFREERAAALLAGVAAHAILPLEAMGSAAFALVLATAGHAVGWPFARGGSQSITCALTGCLRELGGELRLGERVTRFEALPRARAYLFDLAPKPLIAILGDRLPEEYRARLARFRHGPGVFKMDWALCGPIPWKSPACARAGTVHLGGTLEQIALAERAIHAGRLAERPFVLVTQPSLFDPTRAPPGKHTAWAYCHVPHGSEADASKAIEDQIERAAPGFRDQVLARATRTAAKVEAYNPNFVGGDINAGSPDREQLLFRPIVALDPYRTPMHGVFLCSSSTPPGGGVHGMCGYWAARSVLAHLSKG